MEDWATADEVGFEVVDDVDDADGNEAPMRRGVATAMRSNESAHTWHQGADSDDDDDPDEDDDDDEEDDGVAVNSKSTM